MDDVLTVVVLRLQKLLARAKSNGSCEVDTRSNMERLWEINSDLVDKKAEGNPDAERRQLG